MKKIIVFLVICTLGVACQNSNDYMEYLNITDTSGTDIQPNSLNGWDKPYDAEEIIKLKRYIEVKHNRLVLTKDIHFAIDSLNICQKAYEDLKANITDVNRVIEHAERDSFEINLQYPFPKTRSEYNIGYIFTKNSTISDMNIAPIRLKSSSETDITNNVQLASMSANSSCSFLSSTVRVQSKTHINTSVFIWSFMIYDEVWGHHNGANGIGVIGENNGNYEYSWLYSLDNHTGEFNWRFRNVSSDTDGVTINHSFWGGKVKKYSMIADKDSSARRLNIKH